MAIMNKIMGFFGKFLNEWFDGFFVLLVILYFLGLGAIGVMIVIGGIVGLLLNS